MRAFVSVAHTLTEHTHNQKMPRHNIRQRFDVINRTPIYYLAVTCISYTLEIKEDFW